MSETPISDTQKPTPEQQAAFDNRVSDIFALRSLTVMLQEPQDGGLAAERDCAQVCVGDPADRGRIHAHCGPGDNQESRDDAALFAASPHLYAAAFNTQRVLRDLVWLGDATLNTALRELEAAIALAHREVKFDGE